MKRNWIDLFSQARIWGVDVVHASSEASKEQALEVYRQSENERFLVSRLSCERGEFVFRYDPNYAGDPISAFPNTVQEYRSSRLWPFFAIRIPPLDREDMRKEIESQALDKDKIIEILGSVAKVSVTNPYEFKLAGS